MGLEMVSRVRRYQGQCRALQPLGHQGYRLRSYKKDPPLDSGYTAPTHGSVSRTEGQKCECRAHLWSHGRSERPILACTIRYHSVQKKDNND